MRNLFLCSYYWESQQLWVIYFPVFAGFKGGKGVATLAGFVLAIHPLAALLSLAVFIVVLLLTKVCISGAHYLQDLHFQPLLFLPLKPRSYH